MESSRGRLARALAVCATLVALAPAASRAGTRPGVAAHGLRSASAHRGVHVSHGVEVLRGCGFAPRRHLAARPVADRPLRRAPQLRPPGGPHAQPVWIFVDDGPEIVIENPGVVIIVE